MRTDFPAGLLTNLRSETPTLALLWRVDKNDGTQVRGTDHDEDLELLGDTGEGGGVYYATSNIIGSQFRSSTDLSVDNMEVGGSTPTASNDSPPTITFDVAASDIEAGLFQGASVYVYLVNWQASETDNVLLRRGYLGEISRDSEGKYSAEMRGMTQLLQQVFVRTYGDRCEVKEFGDEECKKDVEALERTGVVTAITNRRKFTATVDTEDDEDVGNWFSLGKITFTSGDNIGVTREVRSDFEETTFGNMVTWDTFPFEIQVDDEFTIKPGCDRLPSTCKMKYGNFLNFHGYGIFVEGIDAIQKGPT